MGKIDGGYEMEWMLTEPDGSNRRVKTACLLSEHEQAEKIESTRRASLRRVRVVFARQLQCKFPVMLLNHLSIHIGGEEPN